MELKDEFCNQILPTREGEVQKGEVVNQRNTRPLRLIHHRFPIRSEEKEGEEVDEVHLHVRERFEGIFAVIASHSALTYTTEIQIGMDDMQTRRSYHCSFICVSKSLPIHSSYHYHPHSSYMQLLIVTPPELVAITISSTSACFSENTYRARGFSRCWQIATPSM